MPLKNCKTCGQHVAESSMKCPHCGEDLEPTVQLIFRTVLAIVFAVPVSILCYNYMTDLKKTEDARKQVIQTLHDAVRQP